MNYDIMALHSKIITSEYHRITTSDYQNVRPSKRKKIGIYEYQKITSQSLSKFEMIIWYHGFTVSILYIMVSPILQMNGFGPTDSRIGASWAKFDAKIILKSVCLKTKFSEKCNKHMRGINNFETFKKMQKRLNAPELISAHPNVSERICRGPNKS